MRIYTYVLAVLTSLTACLLPIQSNAQDQKSVTVPITYIHDLITVSVLVNNEGPYPFIVDTGSTTTVLYSGFSSQQDILQSGTTTSQVHGLNASQRRPLLKATQFRLGDFYLGTVFPVEAPPWTGKNTVAGIIGTDILGTHGIIIDSKEKTLTVATPDVFEAMRTPSWRSVRLKANPYDRKHSDGLFFVHMKIDSQSRIPAIFDTGSQFSMMNQGTANRFFRNGQISNGSRKWVHQDVLTSQYINKYVRIPKLRMGPTKWKKAEIVVKDMSTLDAINKDRRPLMIIGMDLMEGRDFAINFPEKRLYLSGLRDVKADLFSGYRVALNDVPISQN